MLVALATVTVAISSPVKNCKKTNPKFVSLGNFKVTRQANMIANSWYINIMKIKVLLAIKISIK